MEVRVSPMEKGEFAGKAMSLEERQSFVDLVQ